MAEAPIYYYETEIQWQGDKDLQITSGKLPLIAAGAPPEFKGRAGVWAPEHLFVASFNSCYMLALLAIAQNSKVAIVSFTSSAKGKLEKIASGTYQVSEIVVKPRVVVDSVKNVERMPRLLEKAKENCFVSNSIKSAIKIEPEVFHRQTQTTPCPLS